MEAEKQRRDLILLEEQKLAEQRVRWRFITLRVILIDIYSIQNNLVIHKLYNVNNLLSVLSKQVTSDETRSSFS